MGETLLRISPDLALPIDAVTGTFGILATKGAGKSNAAVVMAEEMWDAGVPWVAIDPKGDWHGIRSSADGKKPGLSVPVLGGRYGDVPIGSTEGSAWADVVLRHRMTCVIDVSQFTKADTVRFLLAFGTHLFRHADDDGAEPLHLFLEEAHEYLPQQVSGDVSNLVNAWQRIVKQGRFKGLGCTMISQRSSSLNKDVLELVDTLIVLRTIGPRSREAVKAWVKDQDIDAGLLASLPTLGDGEAWIWSPGELRLMQRIRFRRRRTFDSGSTPKVGQARRAPATLADVDLAAIKEQMAETIERAKADDPKELRKRIAQLEKQIAERPAETVVETVTEIERIEVPVLDEGLVLRLEQALSPATGLLAEVQERLAWDVRQQGEVLEFERRLRDRQDVPRAGAAGSSGPAGRLEGGRTPQRPDPPARREPRRAPVPRTEAAAGDVDASVVNEPRQKILDALAWYAGVGVEPVSRSHLAFVAGTSPSSSGYEKNLGALRTAGLLDYPAGGMVALTDAGAALAQPAADIATTEELLDVLEGRLGKPKGAILRVLVDVYPDALTREELAELVDVSPQSSGFEKNVGSLRSLGLVEYPLKGSVAALPILFLGGR